MNLLRFIAIVANVILAVGLVIIMGLVFMPRQNSLGGNGA